MNNMFPLFSIISCNVFWFVAMIDLWVIIRLFVVVVERKCKSISNEVFVCVCECIFIITISFCDTFTLKENKVYHIRMMMMMAMAMAMAMAMVN